MATSSYVPSTTDDIKDVASGSTLTAATSATAAANKIVRAGGNGKIDAAYLTSGVADAALAQRVDRIEFTGNALLTPPPTGNKQIVNPLSSQSLGGSDVYPVSNWIFTSNQVATIDGYLTQARIAHPGAVAGRTVVFYILRPTANAGEFTAVWTSGVVAAAGAGITTYDVPAPFAAVVQPGDRIGALCTAPSIFSYPGASPAAFYYRSAGAMSLNQTAAFSISGQFIFLEGTVIEKNLYVGAQWAGKANGFATLDSSRCLPNSIYRSPDQPWAGKRILWLGTSIPSHTYGVGDGANLPYPNMIADALQATVINNAQGSSGVVWNGTRQLSLSATLAELSAVYGAGQGYASYENLMLGKTPDLVVFDHGFNDRGYPVGTINSTDRSTIYGAFNYLMNALYAENVGVRVAFVTPPTRYAQNGSSEIGPTAIARNAVLAIADKYCCPVCDLTIQSGFNPTTQLTYNNDSLHPNSAGRTVLARILYSFLRGI